MWDKVKQAKEAHKVKLKGLPNVVGVACGFKRTGGQVTDIEAVLVFVKKKLPREQLSAETLVPPVLMAGDAQGVATDVIESHDLKKLPATIVAAPPLLVPNQQKQRPVVGGLSISPGNFLLAGTGGLIVERDGLPMVLSNTHVLRLSEIYDPSKRPQKGLYVRQPAFLDDGKPTDSIGTLEDWIETRFPGPNTVDAAVARLNVQWKPDILGIGKPKGIDDPQIGQVCRKSGRTSGVSQAAISGLDGDFQIDYSNDPNQPIIADFTGLVVSDSPFMQPGDSGSVWVAGDTVVALGFAGSDTISLAIPIKTVFQALNLSLPLVASPADVLASLVGNVLCWGYQAQDQTWALYDSSDATGSDLITLVPGSGYWLKVEQDQVLSYGGFQWNLYKGWNLIGMR